MIPARFLHHPHKPPHPPDACARGQRPRGGDVQPAACPGFGEVADDALADRVRRAVAQQEGRQLPTDQRVGHFLTDRAGVNSGAVIDFADAKRVLVVEQVPHRAVGVLIASRAAGRQRIEHRLTG